MRLDAETLKRARPELYEDFCRAVPNANMGRLEFYTWAAENTVQKRPHRIEPGVLRYLEA